MREICLQRDAIEGLRHPLHDINIQEGKEMEKKIWLNFTKFLNDVNLNEKKILTSKEMQQNRQNTERE